MPTYEYACKKCGHEFEVLQSMSAPPLLTCSKEVCAQKKWGRGKVTKKISAGAGLLFKGSGFYITDYRSEGYKKSAKTDALPAKASGGDVKPAAAPASPAAKPDKK
ncbi:MAG: zinc ribbon domain-containing protein [Verrucomicrobiales bacterium]|nr:zinc ribbon domain-containing protein [Verrucomicrobiales bacterium]